MSSLGLYDFAFDICKPANVCCKAWSGDTGDASGLFVSSEVRTEYMPLRNDWL